MINFSSNIAFSLNSFLNSKIIFLLKSLESLIRFKMILKDLKKTLYDTDAIWLFEIIFHFGDMSTC